jgi:hypothetical protein
MFILAVHTHRPVEIVVIDGGSFCALVFDGHDEKGETDSSDRSIHDKWEVSWNLQGGLLLPSGF